MDVIVNMIMGDSTTLDAYVIVRLVVLMMILELVSLMIAYLSGLKR